MGDLSINLSRKEFACKCGCGFDTADHKLVEILQNAVFYFQHKYNSKVIIIITSGSRCVGHNKKIGGARSSQHIFGRAADHKLFIVDEENNSKNEISPEEIYNYYVDKYEYKYGIGIYPSWIHIDTRSTRAARWDSR